MTFEINSEAELISLAEHWLELNPEPCIVLFNAPMGAGKTTFIKSLCQVMSVKDNISSPTFSLVNEYKSEHYHNIFHFDLYRVEEVEELYDLGFEEYLEKNAYVFIEWPEIGMDFYPDQLKKVNISVKDNVRIFEFE